MKKPLYSFMRNGSIFFLSLFVVSGLMGQSKNSIINLDAERIGAPIPASPEGFIIQDVGTYDRLKGFKTGTILFNNGPLITGTCAASGANESFLDSGIGLSNYGWNANLALNYTLADDFTIPVGQNWVLESADVYAYQTGSSTVPTITEVYIRIWNGIPGGVGSAVIWGDLVTNRMISASFSGIYRLDVTCNTERPIMVMNVDLQNQSLGAGT